MGSEGLGKMQAEVVKRWPLKKRGKASTLAM